MHRTDNAEIHAECQNERSAEPAFGNDGKLMEHVLKVCVEVNVELIEIIHNEVNRTRNRSRRKQFVVESDYRIRKNNHNESTESTIDREKSIQSHEDSWPALQQFDLQRVFVGRPPGPDYCCPLVQTPLSIDGYLFVGLNRVLWLVSLRQVFLNWEREWEAF